MGVKLPILNERSEACFSRSDPITLTGWSDSDWASDTITEINLGLYLQLGSGTISWSSKKQAMVTTFHAKWNT